MDRPKPPNPAKSKKAAGDGRPTLQACLIGHAGPVRATGMKFAATLMEDSAEYITKLEAYIAYLEGQKSS